MTEVAKISLVDTDASFYEDEALKTNHRYVTLSHCWGGVRPYILSPTTEDELRDGVEIDKLPRTFQDAIRFASQLHKVGWVWIDSLCIIQDGPEHEKDWLDESACMQSVYKNAYLNISATAAPNSFAGLHHEREPKKALVTTLPQPAGIRRCVLIEASYWDKLVTRAPVNTRAWVLQERLMAPRVLHFCSDQIAWECSTFAAAEGHPESIPKYGLRNDRIQPEIPVKGLDPMKHGKQLRQTYSGLDLTNDRDKLIALSGIAEQMHMLLYHRRPLEYVAGLWDHYFESQLLW
ncbi:HET-domain-containing protein, partial [Cryphonectria parasitica EP155]